MDQNFDALRLENQLCFPLYVCSKEIVRKYKPLLNELDLTYTQYICMLVLWEHKELTLTEMGEFLFLDSGTLTPVLKKLEQKGYICRDRIMEDERMILMSLTPKGRALKKKAVKVPEQMGCCLDLSAEEKKQLYQLLYKALGSLSN